MALKGFDNVAEPGLKEVLRDNIIAWLDYGLLEKGGYINVAIPDYTTYGDFHKLSSIDGSTTQFGSRRGNWVWENFGTSISGVYVDGALVTSGYEINYRDGIVTFDNAQTGEITLNYSHKYVQVFNAQQNEFFRSDLDSFKIEDQSFLVGSGVELAKNRIQLPAIAVEVINSDSARGFEIGNTSQIRENRIMLTVLSNNDSEGSRIADFLTYQQDKQFKLYDPAQMASSGYYPLNYDGTVHNASGTYNYLTETFPFNKVMGGLARVSKASTEEFHYITPDLCQTTVRMNVETVLR